MGIKEPHMDFGFIVAKSATGKDTALAATADSVLSKLDKQGTKESDCQTLPRQGRIVLQNSCFTKVCQIL